MKLTDLSTESVADPIEPRMSQVTAEFLRHRCEIIPMFSEIDFDSERCIEKSIDTVIDTFLSDGFIINKSVREKSPITDSLYKRYKKLYESVNYMKWRKATAEEFATSIFLPRSIRNNTAAMFSSEPSEELYNDAVEKMKRLWQFTDDDIEALRYFVCQCMSTDMDTSLNRAIYMWGDKGTGKTSIAKAFISILNGEKDSRNIGKFSSNIPTELRFNSFDAPRSIYANATLMDEAFSGTDTKKYYGKFKETLTSGFTQLEVKWGSKDTLKAKHNYFFTSNDPPESIIYDEKERRFFEIKLSHTPGIMTQSEVYDLVKQFCINCTPKEPFDVWYRNTMPDNVVGKVGIQLADRISILTDLDFTRYFELYNKTQVNFPSYFHKVFQDNGIPKTAQENDLNKAAVIKLFGEPKGSGNRRYYNIRELNEILAPIIEGTIDLGEEFITDDLPF